MLTGKITGPWKVIAGKGDTITIEMIEKNVEFKEDKKSSGKRNNAFLCKLKFHNSDAFEMSYKFPIGSKDKSAAFPFSDLSGSSPILMNPVFRRQQQQQ